MDEASELERPKNEVRLRTLRILEVSERGVLQKPESVDVDGAYETGDGAY